MGVEANYLGVEANYLLDQEFITKQEETDAVLEQIKEDYNFENITDAYDDGIVHEGIDFFYGGTMKILFVP